MAKVIENTLTLSQAITESKELKTIVDIIDQAIQAMQKDPTLLKPRRGMRKEAQEFMEYQRQETLVYRNPAHDRVFPLDTVAIQEYRTAHEAAVETAMIHTGPAADEFARSMNALAVTIAGDIYFRNNAYNPHDEEGRKLLAHELTHVTQYAEKRITKETTKEALEAEATHAERQAEYDPDPFIVIPVQDTTIRLRTSQMKVLTKLVADEVEEWIERQKSVMDEHEYLDLLCAYSSWLGEAM